jgi:uncharacterized tellurite resistance protein B-like protein
VGGGAGQGRAEVPFQHSEISEVNLPHTFVFLDVFNLYREASIHPAPLWPGVFTMRSYPRNSPEAAARLVVLALLADGQVCEHEMALLNRLSVASALGLSPARLHTVLREFCEDLQHTERLSWASACCLSEDTLCSLLAEIDDLALRLQLLRLCAEVVEADGLVTEGESLVLSMAVDQWGLQRQMLGKPDAPASPPLNWRQAA